MSVIVKGMEMPLNCAMCERWSICECLKEYKDYESILYAVDDGDLVRADDCPLVEIPTTHGRLIDADKLMMSLADWWYSSFGEEETDEAKAIRTVMDKIEQSIGEMTVVEAEGSET